MNKAAKDHLIRALIGLEMADEHLEAAVEESRRSTLSKGPGDHEKMKRFHADVDDLRLSLADWLAARGVT